MWALQDYAIYLSRLNAEHHRDKLSSYQCHDF